MKHHGAGLRKLIEDEALVEALSTDWRSAKLSGADRQMLEYTEKLTLRPWDMDESDVVALRERGFSDGAILDINQVTSYYAFANRLADGLGIELEPIHQK